MRNEISLSVVVLVFNEEAALEGVVRDLRRFLPGAVREYEILIVDDGSRDRTPAIAARMAAGDSRVRVVTHAENMGLSQAARAGYREARCEYVIWIEGDGQFLVEDLAGFLKLVPRYGVVASCRQRGGNPIVRRLVSGAYNLVLRAVFGLEVGDAGSVIMVKKGLIADHALITEGVVVNAELLLRAKGLGHAIGQCPRTFVPRVSGASRIFGVREILRAIRDLWRLYRNPPGAGPCSGC